MKNFRIFEFYTLCCYPIVFLSFFVRKRITYLLISLRKKFQIASISKAPKHHHSDVFFSLKLFIANAYSSYLYRSFLFKNVPKNQWKIQQKIHHVYKMNLFTLFVLLPWLQICTFLFLRGNIFQYALTYHEIINILKSL